MKTKDFDFDIDARVMPTDPSQLRGRHREHGRMVVLDRVAATITHTTFPAICDHLQSGDLLVLNDSYMLSNSLRFMFGEHEASVIVYGHEPGGMCIAKICGLPPLKSGIVLTSADNRLLTCSLLSSEPDGLWRVRFEPAEQLIPALDRYGWRSDETIPIDPVHWRDSPEAFRSVYARTPGSLEIPSAGLHFFVELLRKGLQEVEWVIFSPHSFGSMQVRIFKRRYSSSRTP